MALFSKDTIVALATSQLPAGVAVIRLSGAFSKEIADKMCPSFVSVHSHQMHYGKILSRNGDLLDECLMVYFKNPTSFTGEDVVEIHCHGGKAVIDGLLEEIYSFHDAEHIFVRPAEAGEFSHRAFLNGKMDLTAAEAVADLVDAQTKEQKNQALKQMKGELGVRFDGWRSQIMHLLAHTEAAIDFPDEELDVLQEAGLQEKMTALLEDLEASVATDVGQRLREGFSVVIVGEPNAGKSSLTNLLTGMETAIVSDIAGTTRDVVQSHLNIEGFPVVLSDTAGLRETEDVIERIGVDRAKSRAGEADLVILVTDARKWPEIDTSSKAYLKDGSSLVVLSHGDIVNINQMVELGFDADIKSFDKIKNHKVNHIGFVNIDGVELPCILSNLTDRLSLGVILSELAKLIRARFEVVSGGALLSRERHKTAVREAIAHLKRAQKLYQNPHEAYSLSELLAQDFRDAAACIGRVTGKTTSEDVLDLVFSTFCIGK